jgi:hypothetical protein
MMLANLLIIIVMSRCFKLTLSNLNYFLSFFLPKRNFVLNLQPQFKRLAHGVTGNTSGFGPEESRFEP